MILDIDHVAFSSTRFDNDIKFLHNLNYKKQFTIKDLPNISIKSNLLHSVSQTHDLALLTSTTNFGIELLNHGEIHEVSPYIYPIFENLPSEYIESYTRKKILNFDEVMTKISKIPVYTNQKKNSHFIFNKLFIKTSKLKKSTNFWKLFGFKVKESSKEYVLLEFKSLFTEKIYYLYLIHSNEINQKYYLDDKGPNCITLISNSILSEKKLLDKNRIYTTSIDTLKINYKLFDIFFTLGPSNEIVEIISLIKSKSSS